MHYEMDFKIIKSGEEIIGFSLVAQPHTESEVFCSTFPQAVVNKKADILIDENELVFSHTNCPDFPGEYKVEVEPESLKAIQELLEGDRELSFAPAGFFTPGFKIILSDKIPDNK